jgi:hypothetical protein
MLFIVVSLTFLPVTSDSWTFWKGWKEGEDKRKILKSGTEQ